MLLNRDDLLPGVTASATGQTVCAPLLPAYVKVHENHPGDSDLAHLAGGWGSAPVTKMLLGTLGPEKALDHTGMSRRPPSKHSWVTNLLWCDLT